MPRGTRRRMICHGRAVVVVLAVLMSAGPEARRSRTLKVVQFNPLHLAEERVEEVARSTDDCDAVLLVGTQRRAAPDRPIRERRLQGGRVLLEAGWRSARGSNRSAGVALAQAVQGAAHQGGVGAPGVRPGQRHGCPAQSL